MWNRKKKGLPGVPISTLVGGDTSVHGDVQFTGGCHVDGHVKGNLHAAGEGQALLSISEHGSVEGTVRAPHVVLNGTVRGDVYAGERVELGPTACVIGNVHYRLIEMAMGAEVNGKLVHVTGDQPLLAHHGNTASEEPATLEQLRPAHPGAGD